MRTEVARFTNPAQDHRVAIVRDDRGHYSWTEECLVTIDQILEGGGIPEYWRTDRRSGIHATEAGALAEAATVLEWFGVRRTG